MAVLSNHFLFFRRNKDNRWDKEVIGIGKSTGYEENAKKLLPINDRVIAKKANAVTYGLGGEKESDSDY